MPDALALSARLQQGSPPVHLSERHTVRGVLALDPQGLRPEHDAPLTEALRRALESQAVPDAGAGAQSAETEGAVQKSVIPGLA